MNIGNVILTILFVLWAIIFAFGIYARIKYHGKSTYENAYRCFIGYFVDRDIL